MTTARWPRRWNSLCHCRCHYRCRCQRLEKTAWGGRSLYCPWLRRRQLRLRREAAAAAAIGTVKLIMPLRLRLRLRLRNRNEREVEVAVATICRAGVGTVGRGGTEQLEAMITRHAQPYFLYNTVPPKGRIPLLQMYVDMMTTYAVLPLPTLGTCIR